MGYFAALVVSLNYKVKQFFSTRDFKLRRLRGG
jgi:hypothetical protein